MTYLGPMLLIQLLTVATALLMLVTRPGPARWNLAQSWRVNHETILYGYMLAVGGHALVLFSSPGRTLPSGWAEWIACAVVIPLICAWMTVQLVDARTSLPIVAPRLEPIRGNVAASDTTITRGRMTTSPKQKTSRKRKP